MFLVLCEFEWKTIQGNRMKQGTRHSCMDAGIQSQGCETLALEMACNNPKIAISGRYRGREGSQPPLPPNRTGGFPAYGSPVGSFRFVTDW